VRSLLLSWSFVSFVLLVFPCCSVTHIGLVWSEWLVLMAKRFPREFRVRAVELVRISDRPLSQVARELGVSNSALWRWVAEDDFAKAAAENPSGVVPVLDTCGGVFREGESAPKKSFRLIERLTAEDPHRSLDSPSNIFRHIENRVTAHRPLANGRSQRLKREGQPGARRSRRSRCPCRWRPGCAQRPATCISAIRTLASTRPSR
jgi:transposase-like protein